QTNHPLLEVGAYVEIPTGGRRIATGPRSSCTVRLKGVFNAVGDIATELNPGIKDKLQRPTQTLGLNAGVTAVEERLTQATLVTSLELHPTKIEDTDRSNTHVIALA